MPERDEDKITVIYKHLVGDLEKPGLTRQVHENKKDIKKTQERVSKLEETDKNKLKKELALAGSIIIILIGIIANLLK